MNIDQQTHFSTLYQKYLNELKLQGKADRTIESYSRGLRQLSEFFDYCPDHLTIEQLKTYFLDLATNKSWLLLKLIAMPSSSFTSMY